MLSEVSRLMQSVESKGDARVYQSKLWDIGDGHEVYENKSHLFYQDYVVSIPCSILTQFVVLSHNDKQLCRDLPLDNVILPVPPQCFEFMVLVAPFPFFHKVL